MSGKTTSTNAALLKIVDSATSTLELEDLLLSILTTIKEVTGADSASILLEENGKIAVKAALGIDIYEEPEVGFALEAGEGLAGTIFRTSEPLFVEDVTTNSMVVNPYLKTSGIRSYLGVPIKNRGRTIGVLHIDWKEVHRHTAKEVVLLTIIADRCGAAIANANQFAELKKAEMKFRKLFDNMSGMAGIAKVVRDPQGHVVDWEITDLNKATEKAIGVPRKDLVGRRATEVKEMELQNGALGASEEVIASGIPARYESKWRGLDLVSSIFPIGGDEFAWLGMDMSDLKNKERLFAETSSYFENLLDYANAPIIVWDMNLRITKFNHAFEHLTGFKSSEMLGRKLDVLFPKSSRDISLDHIYRTSSGAHWESVEIPILCANGSVRIVLWNSATIFRQGTEDFLATIAQGQDITERKEAVIKLAETSSYLENLIDYANAPIIVWDPDYKVIRFNRAFEHLTGRKAADVLQKRLDLLFPAVSREETMQKIRKTSSGEHWESVEIPIQRLDGSVRLVLWNSANISAPGTNRIFATIAQGQDITDRKAAERELLRSNAELEQFAYVASHDLKEPLRMISGFLELLKVRYQGKIDPEADEFIRFAINGAGRMNELIEDLLQYSRIGRATWKPERASMQDAYKQAVNNLATQIRESDAVVTRGDLPTIVFDRLQMTTLLQNLIGNAIKFRSQAQPVIELKAKKEDGGWTFSVRDNGIGFSMKYSERIFELFERLHSKEKYPGTGIGLAICKKIVERHGGRIWAESIEGVGSTFFFTIPDDVGALHEPT